MQLQWRKATSVYAMGATLALYVYGPCLMYEYQFSNYNKIKRLFVFRDRRFITEGQLIRYVDSVAHD